MTNQLIIDYSRKGSSIKSSIAIMQKPFLKYYTYNRKYLNAMIVIEINQ